jgi:prepilin-type N-terminal cleavage/methylation domain-containing protein
VNSRNSDIWQVPSDEVSAPAANAAPGQASCAACPQTGFTLIELLVVISILGILAALAVPALKNIGKSNISVSGSRQLLDDLARARQLAMSQRTTVYMVFMPTNFWNTTPSSGTLNLTWWNSLSPAAKTDVTNLCDKQLTGYTFVSLRSVGDQPGRGMPRYLAPWQNLPDGTFIAQQKFMPPNQSYYIPQFPQFPQGNPPVPIYGFAVTNSLPFPTATNTSPAMPFLPYIAFNYLGQLTVDGQNLAGRDEYIPLAQGSVSPAIDVATRTYTLNPPAIAENPPGNSTNIYNIIHIDALTGRAVLEYQQVQ